MRRFFLLEANEPLPGGGPRASDTEKAVESGQAGAEGGERVLHGPEVWEGEESSGVDIVMGAQPRACSCCYSTGHS